MSKKRMGIVLSTPLLALLAAGLFPVRAQGVVGQKAPLSPRFTAWQASHQARGVPGPAGGTREGGMRVRGFIPPPIDLSHVHGPIFTQLAGSPPYPALFDLRTEGLLTPVKDQGEYGTCWSFACMGSMESTMLRAGLGAFTLSEWDLAYYAYTPFNTSLLTAFTPGIVYPGEDPIFDQGGNDWISTALLARGTGAVNNKDCPYQLGGYIPAPIPEGNLPNGRERVSVPLRAAQYLFSVDAPTSTTDIKYSLTHYGPAVISIDWEDPNFDSASNTYRDISATAEELNHEVCIVGWNDNFETCRFPANNRPAAPGAWIVRNSWSRLWGNAGYFYLSYDSHVFDGTVFQGGPRASHHIYQYDPLGWVNSIGLGSPSAVCANIYRAEGQEQITAISFYTGAVNTRYEVDLRTGVDGDPSTGISASGSAGLPPQMGTFLAPGYHILTLDRPVPVAAGSNFAVLVGLTTPGYNYPIPVQESEQGYSESATAEHGRSYISADGATWTDLSPDCQGAVACVKAFAEGAD